MNAIEVSGLHVWRGEAHVLHGIDITVAASTVTALLGRNGVGKSTTLMAMMGLLRSSGSVRLAGTDTTGRPTHRIALDGVGYVPEDREVFAALTVAENLRLSERPGREARYDLVFELFPDLADRRTQRAGTLSGGQQQMLALSRALLNPTEVLLVDEPTKGLAPIIVEQVVEALRRATSDTTVLLVEQNLWVAAELATTAVVLDQGEVVYRGQMELLSSDADLAGRYLGVEVR